jgi:hypothetical protein
MRKNLNLLYEKKFNNALENARETLFFMWCLWSLSLLGGHQMVSVEHQPFILFIYLFFFFFFFFEEHIIDYYNEEKI